jgi:hypothetical protein
VPPPPGAGEDPVHRGGVHELVPGRRPAHLLLRGVRYPRGQPDHLRPPDLQRPLLQPAAHHGGELRHGGGGCHKVGKQGRPITTELNIVFTESYQMRPISLFLSLGREWVLLAGL